MDEVHREFERRCIGKGGECSNKLLHIFADNYSTENHNRSRLPPQVVINTINHYTKCN